MRLYRFVFLPLITILPCRCSNQNSQALDQAISLYNDNMLKEALPLFEEAVSLDRENPEAYAWLAETYRRLGDTDKAISAAHKSLNIDSCNSFAHTVIADAYRLPPWDSRSNSDSNWVHLLAAVQCDSTDGNAWMSLWNEAVLRDELTMANKALKKLMESGFLTNTVLAYGRWMLRTLPDSAILITNGDMDTYPPLALQLVENFRPDVAVIERGLLNTRQYLEIIRDRYQLTLPISIDHFDSLRQSIGVNRDGPSVSELIFRGLIAQKQNGSLTRPLAAAITVDREYYSPFEEQFQFAGPFLLWEKTPFHVNLTASIEASIKSIRVTDFAGPWVSDRDRSPIRRKYTKFLSRNITETALVYCEDLIKLDRAGDASDAIDWIEEFTRVTGQGSEFGDRISDLKKRISEKNY